MENDFVPNKQIIAKNLIQWALCRASLGLRAVQP